MFQRLKDMTIAEAQFIFDSIYDSEISQENPDSDYDSEFGRWLMQELARDERLANSLKNTSLINNL